MRRFVFLLVVGVEYRIFHLMHFHSVNIVMKSEKMVIIYGFQVQTA